MTARTIAFQLKSLEPFQSASKIVAQIMRARSARADGRPAAIGLALLRAADEVRGDDEREQRADARRPESPTATQALTASSERVSARPTLERTGASVSPSLPTPSRKTTKRSPRSALGSPLSRTLTATLPSSSSCAERITEPPAGVWSMALARRLSTAWPSEARSARDPRQPLGDGAAHEHARASGLAAHAQHAGFEQRHEIELGRAAARSGRPQPRVVVELVDQRRDLLAGGLDVARIFEVARVVDRAERRRADQVGRSR